MLFRSCSLPALLLHLCLSVLPILPLQVRNGNRSHASIHRRQGGNYSGIRGLVVPWDRLICSCKIPELVGESCAELDLGRVPHGNPVNPLSGLLDQAISRRRHRNPLRRRSSCCGRWRRRRTARKHRSRRFGRVWIASRHRWDPLMCASGSSTPPTSKWRANSTSTPER